MKIASQLTGIALALTCLGTHAEKPSKETLVPAPEPTTKTMEATAAPTKAAPAIIELFGEELRNAKMEKVSTHALAGKTIGVYFSAHWCGPCRQFTPALLQFHKKMEMEGKPFEVVFISSDKNEEAMYEYMTGSQMPWLALPYGDARKEKIKTKFENKYIPYLVILDENGNVLTKGGRANVANKGAAAYDEWMKNKKPATSESESM